MGQLISRLKKKKEQQPLPPPPPPRPRRVETAEDKARKEYERIAKQHSGVPEINYQRELAMQTAIAETRATMLRQGSPNIRQPLVKQTVNMLRQNEVTNLANRGIPLHLAEDIVRSAPVRSLTSRRYRGEPIQSPTIRREITQAEIRGMPTPLESSFPSQEQASLGTTPRPSMEYKKGGMVKKTGLALVHKGELVVPATRVKSVEKAVKKAGLKPLKK